jgi:hypothetical protein
MGGTDRTETERCRHCGRETKHYSEVAPNDPAMDCGGDCWGCVAACERWLRSLDWRRRGGKARGG